MSGLDALLEAVPLAGFQAMLRRNYESAFLVECEVPLAGFQAMLRRMQALISKSLLAQFRSLDFKPC